MGADDEGADPRSVIVACHLPQRQLSHLSADKSSDDHLLDVFTNITTESPQNHTQNGPM